MHVTRGQWQLSPAFDINPFPDRQRELKTWISDDTGPVASVDALMSIVPYCRRKGEVERAVATWRIAGRKVGMSERELEQLLRES
jgi:serine/threonine-protein kinase HipA